MLGQYNKIATGKGDRNVDLRKGGTHTIHTNCTFPIKRAFVCLAIAENNSESNLNYATDCNRIALDNLQTGDSTSSYLAFTRSYMKFKVNISGSNINLYLEDIFSDNHIWLKVLEWVAIG